MAIITPPTPDIVSETYGSTAHIVDNFYYKHLNKVTPAEYANHKNSFYNEGVHTSYVKRYTSGEKRYSLVDSLSSDKFCADTAHLIDGDTLN